MNVGSTAAKVVRSPFLFIKLADMLTHEEANRALSWLEISSVWQLRTESFYEQYEFGLLSSPPSTSLCFLVDTHFVAKISANLRHFLDVDLPLELVNIAAHKLTVGQTIRVHNDFIGPDETHRVVIHLNRGWSMEDGGLLMLFGSDRAEDVRLVVPPRHGSAFAFEISQRSYHAVSTVRKGPRYSLVYTFRGNR